MAENEITITRSRIGSRRQGLHTLTANPSARQYENPLVIIPGYLANGNPKVFEDVAREFATLGRKTAIVTFTGLYPGRHLTKTAQERSFPDAATNNSSARLQANQADAFLNSLDQTDLKPDVVTHSLGTQPGLIAVSVAPEQFGDVFLGVTPTGVNKEYPIEDLDIRFAAHIIPETVRNLRDRKSRQATRRHLVAGATLVATHPIRTLFYERRTIRDTNLVEIFTTLAQDDTAPTMMTLAGKKDPVFGPDQLAVVHFSYPLWGNHRAGGHNDFIAGRLTPQINDILINPKNAQTPQNLS